MTLTAAEVREGLALPARSFGPQTRTDIVRYQGASGDFNPVHHDDEFARSGGMPQAFSVGMLQAGYLATYCTDLFGPESVRRFAVRFAEQVWPGDVLTCTGTVAGVSTDAGSTVVEVELLISRDGGGAAVSGSATLVLA